MRSGCREKSIRILSFLKRCSLRSLILLLYQSQADAEEHGASFAFNSSMLKGVITKRNIEIHVGSTEALLPSSGTLTNWLIFTYLVLCHFQA